MTNKKNDNKPILPAAFEQAMKKIANAPKAEVDKDIAKNKKARKRPMRKK